ncbi:methyl-accepting chemotaxis protein [Gorillibacterium sp. sgz5001074]|uniref:methyl-accepting chemotaxis protein n=1 Tax=Gorillibacterium sp. sgz5001074 TaxID=3446695 RepID=UPI003F670A2F
MKVSVKIYMLLGLALAMMAGVGITGLSLISQLKNELTGMYEEQFQSVDRLNQLRINNRAIESFLLEMLLTKDPQVNEKLKTSIADRVARNDTALAEFEAIVHGTATSEDLASYKKLLPVYRESRSKVETLALANKNEEAYALFASSVSAVRDQMNDLLIRMAAADEQVASDGYLNGKAKAEAASRLILLIMISALVLCGAFGWWIIRLVVRPVRGLQHLMERAESGDLTVHGDYDSRDELGRLTRSFNSMIRGLRTLVGKINDTALTVSASSEELTASAEQTAKASEHIASATGEMSVGFEEQVKIIGEIADSMDAMDANLNRMTANGEEVHQVSRQAGELVNSGVQAVGSILRQMNEIDASVRETQSVIDELSTQSEQIGAIVTVIQEIANQTNLLALNASIEAARAGEAGRGFSVVASEIRKLADASGQSSAKISQIIGRVQLEVKQAVGSMERGAGRVQRGMERSRQATEVFTAIEQAVGSVLAKVAEVGVAILETSEESKRIVSSIHHIGSISQEGAASIEETSASSQEQLATMEEVAAAARSLAALAEDLQMSLQQFRL